jgi:hypothetical protein
MIPFPAESLKTEDVRLEDATQYAEFAQEAGANICLEVLDEIFLAFQVILSYSRHKKLWSTLLRMSH